MLIVGLPIGLEVRFGGLRQRFSSYLLTAIGLTGRNSRANESDVRRRALKKTVLRLSAVRFLIE